MDCCSFPIDCQQARTYAHVLVFTMSPDLPDVLALAQITRRSSSPVGEKCGNPCDIQSKHRNEMDSLSLGL